VLKGSNEFPLQTLHCNYLQADGSRPPWQGRIIMSIPPVLRSLAAVGGIAAFSFTPAKSLAGEQNPLVVVGVPPETVALSYPAPQYPSDCVRMRIQGNVEVSIRVQNGKMVKVTASSPSPALAGVSARWIHRNWQFKPSVSGWYVLPILYELDAS
jgi:hypothetical protein